MRTSFYFAEHPSLHCERLEALSSVVLRIQPGPLDPLLLKSPRNSFSIDRTFGSYCRERTQKAENSPEA